MLETMQPIDKFKKTAILQLSKLPTKDFHTKYASEMDGIISSGNNVIMEGDNKVVVVDSTPALKQNRFRSIYETLGKEIE